MHMSKLSEVPAVQACLRYANSIKARRRSTGCQVGPSWSEQEKRPGRYCQKGTHLSVEHSGTYVSYFIDTRVDMRDTYVFLIFGHYFLVEPFFMLSVALIFCR